MSYTIANAAILSATPGLNTSSKMVLIALAQHADASGHCWPGLERISQLTYLSERTVRYAIRKLEDLGLVRCQHRLGTSTRYTLTLGDTSPAPAALAPTPANGAPPPRQMVPPHQSVETLQRIHCAPPAPAPEPPPPPRPAPAPAAPLCVPEELKTIEPQALQDFATVRKAKKKAAIPTRTEAQDLAEQAARAGLTVAQAIRLCIIRDWARFEAAWVQDRYSAQQDAAMPAPQPVQVWKPEPVNAVPPPPEIRAKMAALRAEFNAKTAGKVLMPQRSPA